jgi:DNA invertase Pin-like site-specific DNA recombinase
MASRTTGTTTAAIYTRLSQDRDGLKEGTERQEKDCRALCKREGFKVAKVYVDDDRSAYNGKARPQFDQMLAELDQYDALVFWKYDRLVRRFTQFGRVIEACEKAGVRLVSVVDPIDTSSPLGKGVAGMVASMGEQESTNISLRVTRAQQDAAREGRNHGHRRAFGYKLDGTTILEDEAAAIQEARDRILAGEAMRSICDDWNRRGIRPPGSQKRPGTAWRVTHFKTMITGPRIAGLRRYQGEVVGKATWSGIITPEDHERLVASLGRRQHRGRPPRYLLTRLVRCGRCGATLRSSVSSGAKRRFACRRDPGDDERCGRLQILAEPVEQLVVEMVLHALDSPKMRRSLAQPKRKTKNGDSPERLRAELELLAASAAEIGVAEYLAARKPLEDKLQRALAELAENTDSAALAPIVDAPDIREAWSRLDLERQRAILAAVVDHVLIAPATHGGTLDLDRVQVVWRV